MKGTTALVVLVLFLSATYATLLSAPSVEFRKQLAGPPSEFEEMSIPDPTAASLRADSTLVPFTLEESQGSYTWVSKYPVDTPEQITVTVFSPHKEQLAFYLQSPDDSETWNKIDKSLFDGPLSMGKSYFSSQFGIDGNVVPSYSYVFYNPPTGFWGIKINTSTPVSGPGPHGYLLLDNISPLKMTSHLNSYTLETGQEAGVTVQIVQENPDLVQTLAPSPLNIFTVTKLNVQLPNGQDISVPLHDDGLHADSLANDGIFSGSIQTNQAGDYVFQPVIEGVIGSTPFARSVSHLVSVSGSTLRLGSSATYRYSKDKATIYFDVETVSSKKVETVLAYAQVWGTSVDASKQIPVAWVEAMVDVEDSKFTLQLHENWLSMSKAIAPFTLKRVTLQDRELNTIISEATSIPVQHQAGSELRLLHVLKSIHTKSISEISEDMKYGPRPAQFQIQANNSTLSAAASTGKLVLVHGYCSGDVWDQTHFTDSIKFTDYQASRSQDQFALLIKNFAEVTNKLTSYGIVAHSQGGLAALHLKAYYWSGLDTATGGSGKVIQSVGSPYRGCSLAGSLATLGKFFGVGCSSNSDLATDGAQLWLSKVPKDAQEKVSYYTTTYDDSWFLAPACVTASGMVLHSPNDGTCEIKFSTPDKAGVNMGTTKKFCHTEGMNYPSQTKDASRNAVMNKAAAR